MPQLPDVPTDLLRTLARWALALAMIVAGVAHFTDHASFLALLPAWSPARSFVVWASGVVEIALGVALVALPRARRALGWTLAAFFVLVFPANVYQAVSRSAAFGMDSDLARWGRLCFQPLLIAWALWSTGSLRGDGRGPFTPGA